MIIRFFIKDDGIVYARRHNRNICPQVGDEVRFDGIVFEVTNRTFVEDELQYIDDGIVNVQIKAKI